MAKQLVQEIEEVESEVFQQLTQDEEFSNLLSKFKDDEKMMVVKTIKGMVTNIEKTLKKELKFR